MGGGGAPTLHTAEPGLNVVFIHPDLGLGGAERLVVDAARWLAAAGHRVVILTAHHDRGRAFPETVDGTLDVRVHGRLLPPHVFQRLRAPSAIARMAWLTLATARLAARPDVVVCDLVAHAIPLVRIVGRAPVVFYCHYPDRLLVPERRGLYRWYRAPIDRLEEVGIGMADRVLVNSRFTATRFHDAFPRLRALTPVVVHPGVDPEPYAELSAEPGPAVGTILAVGRYDPQKNLGLAIEAFAALRRRLPPLAFASQRLVIAGGYDSGLREHRETAAALERLARRLEVADRVVLRRSPSEDERRALLSECRCVVYTPEDEHFGYVPVEAMAAGRPVVAVNRGGPTETIVHGETGLLCAPTADAFADALARLLGDATDAARIGRAGRTHVAQHFSHAAFGRRFEAILTEVACSSR